MTYIKTAISIDELLFNKIDEFAKQMHISRSFLFAKAVTDYLQKYENQKILDGLNSVYGSSPEPDEWQKNAKKSYRKVIKGEWQ